MKVAGVVLAAGTGSRLAPLTDHIPKPLLPVLDRSLLEHQIKRLEAAGAEKIHVNLHHHAVAIARHLDSKAPQVIYRVEPELTGPAGALSLFADMLAEYDAVLVASSDVLMAEGFTSLLKTHIRDGAALTFGVVTVTGARRFGVLDIDANGTVTATREKPDVPDGHEYPVSAGVYCLRRDAIEAVVRLLSRSAKVDYASELAPHLLAAGSRVTGHWLEGYWRDVGTAASLSAANRDALEGRIPWLCNARPGLRANEGTVAAYVHPSAVVEAGVTLEGPVVIGAGARVGSAACLSDTLILPGGVVPPHSVVVGGVIAAAPGLDRGLRPTPVPAAGAR